MRFAVNFPFVRSKITRSRRIKDRQYHLKDSTRMAPLTWVQICSVYNENMVCGTLCHWSWFSPLRKRSFHKQYILDPWRRIYENPHNDEERCFSLSVARCICFLLSFVLTDWRWRYNDALSRRLSQGVCRILSIFFSCNRFYLVVFLVDHLPCCTAPITRTRTRTILCFLILMRLYRRRNENQWIDQRTSAHLFDR